MNILRNLFKDRRWNFGAHVFYFLPPDYPNTKVISFNSRCYIGEMSTMSDLFRRTDLLTRILRSKITYFKL